MKKGFIPLGQKGNYINVDCIVDHFQIDDGRVVLKDKFGLKWTVDKSAIEGKLSDE